MRRTDQEQEQERRRDGERKGGGGHKHRKKRGKEEIYRDWGEKKREGQRYRKKQR